jgi:hypothetical protein
MKAWIDQDLCTDHDTRRDCPDVLCYCPDVLRDSTTVSLP